MEAEADCSLCKARLQTPVIRETAYWRTAINRNQNLLGKTMICLRRHEELVSMLSAEECFDKDGTIEVKALVKPLVNLIWLAGLVFLAGSLIALWPDAREQRRLAARYARSSVAAPA